MRKGSGADNGASLEGNTARETGGAQELEQAIGTCPALRQVLDRAARAAPLELPVLISGESGTGKELLARSIHQASTRAHAPFVGLNVLAIPRELLESELFGYEGGAFTGASSAGRAGKFEVAARGTILLDEIGDMPAEMQGKLLRVLQERVFQRVGGNRNVPMEARVIATTNRDLERAVRAGAFRLDLYHRLRVVHLHLPPLRERGEDVRLLAESRVRLHSERLGRQFTIAPRVLAAMEAHAWPGNVRELVNVVDSALGMLPTGESLLADVPEALARVASDLPIAGTCPPGAGRGPALRPLAEIIQRACAEALLACGGNVSAAARALGVSKGTLYRRMSTAPVPVYRKRAGPSGACDEG